ncbi:MAG: helix-turn-helix domain-containing protein [Acidimicrobiales bacterium]
MESLSSEVGRRLRERRHERSETLSEVAEVADISSAHLAEIETGKSFCSLPVLLRLSQALEYPMSEILPRLGGNRVRADSIDPELRGARSLSHPELDLAIHEVGLGCAEETVIELSEADALVFVIGGQCSLQIPGHTVELGAGDSADVTKTNSLTLRTSTGVTALVVIGG